MYKRMLKLPLEKSNSIFLFGPRGTGKTAWIKENLKSAIYLDLLNFSIFNPLSSDPSRLEKTIPPNFSDWIVIDEVQRIPELLNEVHRLIEEKKNRFLLTGSSARSLRKKGVNLLAGRAFKYHMHPLIFQEVGNDFNLNKALEFGLLPSVFTNPDPKKYLENYVQTYLKEEVQQEGLTRNIGSFSKFLEAASFSQGQIVNYSAIARELGINRFIVSSYFDILEDLLLGIRINTFTNRAKRKVIAHQKFYFFDTGVFRILRPMGPIDIKQESDGPGLETLFLQSIRAINDYLELGYKIYFWKTIEGQEVDFILYGPHGFHAFEIKRSSQVSGKDFRGLQNFKIDYPEAKLYLLYTGSLKEYHDDITVLPFEEALKELPSLL
jgi:uncharacterized protein